MESSGHIFNQRGEHTYCLDGVATDMDSWDQTTRVSSSVIADHDVRATDVKLTSKVVSDQKIHWFKNYSFTYIR